MRPYAGPNIWVQRFGVTLGMLSFGEHQYSNTWLVPNREVCFTGFAGPKRPAIAGPDNGLPARHERCYRIGKCAT